jgi:hypothetical protein
MFPFNGAVLLMSVWARDEVGNAGLGKISVKFLVFPAPIGLNRANFGAQQEFDLLLELIEHVFNIRFVLQQIDPRKFTEIIKKANIVFEPASGFNCWTPYIRMNKF